MSDSSNGVGYPYVPVRRESASDPGPPRTRSGTATRPREFEHTWELVYFYLVNGFKNLKRLLKMFIIPLAIAMVINIGLESIPTYSLYGILKPIVLLAVAVTASYNSLIPRTLYWIVVFTVGRKIFYRIRREGFGPTLRSFKEFPAVLRNSRDSLGQKFWVATAAAAGAGFGGQLSDPQQPL